MAYEVIETYYLVQDPLTGDWLSVNRGFLLGDVPSGSWNGVNIERKRRIGSVRGWPYW